jgi:uncharacterized protein (DUF1015 family)
MADVRPLPGIRYADTANIAALVTPPYDVISPEAQDRYYARDPHNIIRLELGRDEPGDDALNNRYTRAAVSFAEWRLNGILHQDAPAFYLYEQSFSGGAGTTYKRLGLLARVRLEPWEAGVILPHERTLSKPKDDRLKLYRACAANLSPLMALYDDRKGELAKALGRVRRRKPTVEMTDEAGEGHRLWIVQDEELTAKVTAFFAKRQLYIADGHHRYETGLAYRDEVAEIRKELLEQDTANYTLMSLSAIEDPGLLVLPTHRILRDLAPDRLAALRPTLERHFAVESLGADASPDHALVSLAADVSGDAPAFVLAQPGDTLLLRLRPSGRAAMAALGGEHATASAAWRALDVAVLHELILNQGLGISDDAVRAGEHVSYTRDAAAALTAAREGRDGTQLAVLIRPTPPSAIRDVARAGDRMPQKSTYFYPKLLTGLVINPLW